MLVAFSAIHKNNNSRIVNLDTLQIIVVNYIANCIRNRNQRGGIDRL